MEEHQGEQGQVGRLRPSGIAGNLARSWKAARAVPGVTIRLAFVGVVGLLAATYLLALTPVDSRPDQPDPAAYVGAARNIVDGRGITLPFVPIATDIRPSVAVEYNGAAPLFQYSPGLPVVLATGSVVGIDPAQTDRIVNLASLSLIAVIVAWAVLKLTKSSYVTAAAAVFILLTSAWFMIMFAFVTTETLFSALLLAALVALAGYLATRRTGLAWLFVALAAASGLTRFVGVSVGITGMIAIALWYPVPWRGRVGRALLIGGGAVAPIALWMLRDALAAPGAGGISFHPLDPIYLSGEATATLIFGRGDISWAGWLRYAIGIVVIVGVAGAAWVSLRGARRSASVTPPTTPPMTIAVTRVTFVFLAMYWAALLISTTFFHNAPSKIRYLVPLYPLIVVIGAVAARKTLGAPRTSRSRWLGASVLVCGLVVIGVWHVDAGRTIWTTIREARPLVSATRASWAPALRSLPPDAVIFTSAPNIVEPAVGRFAIAMPTRRSIWSGKANARYQDDLAEISDVLCTRQGVVLVTSGRYSELEANDLAARTNLAVTARFGDSAILRPDPAYCASLRS